MNGTLLIARDWRNLMRSVREGPVFAALLALALVATPADAGQWTVLPAEEDFHTCNFAFSGPINPGDLGAIRDHSAWKDTIRRRVCLDSPGGSLAEVYDFVTTNLATRSNFSTKVRTGARCESACAILFMFGQSAWGSNFHRPARLLEPGARLGFHSPFLDTAAVPDDQRDDAFRVALDVARLLNDQAYKATTLEGPALPIELVSLILSTPGSDMHYVDRLGEVEILGIERPQAPDERLRVAASRQAFRPLIERICVSSYAMTFRNWLVEDGYDFDDLVAWVNDTLSGSSFELHNLVELPPSGFHQTRIVGILSGAFFVPGVTSNAGVLYCRVELSAEPGAGSYDVATAHYGVSFGTLFDLEDDPLPEANREFDVLPAGLVPIDTPY